MAETNQHPAHLPALPVRSSLPVEAVRDRGCPVLVLGLISCLAALGLHASALLFPVLFLDDFALLLNSWTWPAAWENLWLPHNEHTMPLGRLSTWVMVQLGGGRITFMPGLTALQGPLAVLLGMWLIYLLVRRETGQPYCALLAMTFFGVSTQYNQSVTWFAASFVLLALDSTLLALLAAQRWRQTGRRRYLVLCVLWVALAPAWFASGILAGPLCCLYLLPGRGRLRREAMAGAPRTQGGRFRLPAWLPVLPASLGVALVPLVGGLLFLGVLLTRAETTSRIVHSGHYGGQTVFQVCQPFVALGYTGRALVDHLVLGTLGIWNVTCPPVLVPVALAVLVLCAVWWWRRAAHRLLLLLGLGFILGNDLLVYSFRAPWSYEQMSSWNRYDLLPHAGLTLFLAGGLPAWQGRRRRVRQAFLSRRQALVVGLLCGLLFATQLPRGIESDLNCYDSEQMAELRRIEEMDARCREQHIAASTAREALGKRSLPLDDGTGSGWQFLRGSDDPRPLSVEEARRLLSR